MNRAQGLIVVECIKMCHILSSITIRQHSLLSLLAKNVQELTEEIVSDKPDMWSSDELQNGGRGKCGIKRHFAN